MQTNYQRMLDARLQLLRIIAASCLGTSGVLALVLVFVLDWFEGGESDPLINGVLVLFAGMSLATIPVMWRLTQLRAWHWAWIVFLGFPGALRLMTSFVS